MNNEELQFLTDINKMTQDPATLKHLIQSKEIVIFLATLGKKYSREDLIEAIKKVKEAA